MQLAQGHRPITFSVAVLAILVLLSNLMVNNHYLQIMLLVMSIFFIFTLFFFRDPERSIPRSNGVVAAADGKIIEIEQKSGNIIIKTMMSPFNVHVTRMPLTGKIISIDKSDYNILVYIGLEYY